MKIRINTGEGIPGDKTLRMEDGSMLENVSAVDIRIRRGELIIATLEFLLPKHDMLVEATVTEKHLRELADAHGFDIVKRAAA